MQNDENDTPDEKPETVKCKVRTTMLMPEQGSGWSATINGIPAVGTGPTEAAAVCSLAALLGDFVIGHGARIDELEAKLLKIADIAEEAMPSYMLADKCEGAPKADDETPAQS